jgi:hypothetical protein
MAVCGLASVDLSSLTGWQQAILFIQMCFELLADSMNYNYNTGLDFMGRALFSKVSLAPTWHRQLLY